MNIFSPKRVYLDYASSAPIDRRVARVMEDASRIAWHNPSSLYKESVEASRLLEQSRLQVGRYFGVHSDEVIFTGSGTESDNLALRGAVNAFRIAYPECTPHLVVSAIEHSAVLETARMLEQEGCTVTYLTVSSEGVVDPVELKSALTECTVLVSVMYANNEIGVVQPIAEIAKAIRHFKKHHDHKEGFPLFHTDAVQAVQYLPCAVEKLGVDLLTANGSKIYGPRGIGILIKRRHVALTPILSGGNQEFGLRPGTESLDRVRGIAQALELCAQVKEREVDRLTVIRDYAFERIESVFPDVIINGDRIHRLPNNINISFPGYDSEFLVLELDAHGISVSSKSACKSTDTHPSYVLHALRPTHNEQEGSLRISLGRNTKKSDIDRVINALSRIRTKQERVKSFVK